MLKRKKSLTAQSLSASLIAILIGLAGCNSSPPPPKLNVARVQDFELYGYDSGIDYVTSSNSLWLNVAKDCCKISIIQPQREGKYPLVVYLPGLGETIEAAAELRNAWAKSGYTVLTIQTLKDDEIAWTSLAAREADFSYINSDRYSPGIVSNRLQLLSQALSEIQYRVASNDPDFSKIDLSKIAIAGFDIGAYTTMIMAGENISGIPKTKLPVTIKAVIALSPYADFSEPLSERYLNIRVPVLSVTSTTDRAKYSKLPTSLHDAPFHFMPAKEKYLLKLFGASHTLIGNPVTTAVLEDQGQDSNDRDSADTPDGGGPGGGGPGGGGPGGGGPGGGGPGGGGPGGGGPGGGGPRSGGSSGGHGGGKGFGGNNTPTRRAQMAVAIKQVSTAFLNAHVKNDRFSQIWLANGATLWLINIGEIQNR